MKINFCLLLLLSVIATGCTTVQPGTTVQNIGGNVSTGPDITASQNTTPQVINVQMAHNDDWVLSPGGVVYRGNVYGPNEPVWPALGVNTTFISAFNGTIELARRSYIETLAGELRNDFVGLDASAAPNLDDPLKVTYNFVGLPDGVTVNLTKKVYGGIGRPNYRVARVFIELTIPADVKAGEYNYTVHLAYQGTEFGVVPGVLKVFSPAPETCGVTYVPGKFLYVWGTTSSPVTDGTHLASQLGELRTSGTVEGGTWSANFTLGADEVLPAKDFGDHNVYTWQANDNNRVVIGAVSFSIVPPPSPGR